MKRYQIRERSENPKLKYKMNCGPEMEQRSSFIWPEINDGTKWWESCFTREEYSRKGRVVNLNYLSWQMPRLAAFWDHLGYTTVHCQVGAQPPDRCFHDTGAIVWLLTNTEVVIRGGYGLFTQETSFLLQRAYDGAVVLVRPIWKLSLLWCNNAFQLGLKNKNELH